MESHVQATSASKHLKTRQSLPWRLTLSDRKYRYGVGWGVSWQDFLCLEHPPTYHLINGMAFMAFTAFTFIQWQQGIMNKFKKLLVDTSLTCPKTSTDRAFWRGASQLSFNTKSANVESHVQATSASKHLKTTQSVPWRLAPLKHGQTSFWLAATKGILGWNLNVTTTPLLIAKVHPQDCLCPTST